MLNRQLSFEDGLDVPGGVYPLDVEVVGTGLDGRDCVRKRDETDPVGGVGVTTILSRNGSASASVGVCLAVKNSVEPVMSTGEPF